MSITTVLFDLDGTLLPMDADTFARAYFSSLANVIVPFGFDRPFVLKTLSYGLESMARNDGSRSNEAAFWEAVGEYFKETANKLLPALDEYYKSDFNEVSTVCGFAPEAKEILKLCTDKGLKAVLATNPFFPRAATEARVRWAGLEPDMFEYITTYEASNFCKPSLEYYKELLKKLGCCAEECLMVGNDAEEDMVVEKLGMDTFLLTNCFITRNGAKPASWRNGGFKELQAYINTL